MPRVVGIDHLVLSVGDFARSKAYYGKLLKFLGFKLKHDYDDMAGWSNGKTLLWIAAADAQGKQHKYRKGDIGFHHYAFELASRNDVDALGAFSRSQRYECRRSAGRVLRRQLLCRLFHRSGWHEARRHDVGAAQKIDRAIDQAKAQRAKILMHDQDAALSRMAA
jgi:catechol 2,3-dioxygenase-like lactoylglutathione lyase family enzyme